MVLLDYFRILKALIILIEIFQLRAKFQTAIVILCLLFVSMNYVPNQNWKVLEERLAGLNSDDVKPTLRRLRCFKRAVPLL